MCRKTLTKDPRPIWIPKIQRSYMRAEEKHKNAEEESVENNLLIENNRQV
jgi:hypothetical protein